MGDNAASDKLSIRLEILHSSVAKCNVLWRRVSVSLPCLILSLKSVLLHCHSSEAYNDLTTKVNYPLLCHTAAGSWMEIGKFSLTQNGRYGPCTRAGYDGYKEQQLPWVWLKTAALELNLKDKNNLYHVLRTSVYPFMNPFISQPVRFSSAWDCLWQCITVLRDFTKLSLSICIEFK